MSTSVRTKAVKKQSSLSASPPVSGSPPSKERDMERALLALENACQRVLFAECDHRDSECVYWQNKFKNIVTPVSLALGEYKGPRRFHYHYKHREDDESILHPVLENPLDTLAMVVRDALSQSHNNLLGIQDEAFIRLRTMLENAFAVFLQKHREFNLAEA